MSKKSELQKLGRSTWVGSLSWASYVATPIRVWTLTRSTEPCKLKCVCGDCGAPVTTAYRCPVCRRDVEDPDRAHEVARGRFVRVPREAVEATRQAAEDSLKITGVVERDSVPEGVWRSWYVVLPEPGGEIGYEVLRRTLQSYGLLAVAEGPMGRASGQWYFEGGDTVITAHLAHTREAVKDLADFEALVEKRTVTATDVRNARKALGKPKRFRLAEDQRAAALLPLIEQEVGKGNVYADPRKAPADVKTQLERKVRARERREARKAAGA